MAGEPESPIHWPTDPVAAQADQVSLKGRLVTSYLDMSSIAYALAIGVSYSERASTAVAVAANMTLTGELLDLESYYSATAKAEFPYIAGLFAYREGPAICALLDSLPGLPPLAVFDSQGIAHPRGFGLAAHIGVLYHMPTMGLTRRPLFGRAELPREEDKAMTNITDRRGRVIGACMRLKALSEPIYGSPGHLTDIPSLRNFALHLNSFQSGYPKALAFVHETANRLARKIRST